MIYDAATYLHASISHAGIPIVGVSGPPWSAHYDSSATQAQKDQGDAMCAAFDGKPRQNRMLAHIYEDVAALSTKQRNNIWADLSAPTTLTSSKYLETLGGNASGIFVMDWIINIQVPTGSGLIAAQNNVISQYAQDNLMYLVNPPFDTTINIPSTEPIN